MTQSSYIDLPEGLEHKEIFMDCYNSTELFAKTFFPDHFHLEFSDKHKELFDVIDNSDIPYINVIAHRGFGKSTLVNLVLPAKKILFRESNFIMQVAHTAAQAERDSDDLKQNLITNERALAVFGSIKPESRENIFSKEMWKSCSKRDRNGRIAHHGTLVMPRGWGQQVRGLKNGRYRPDFIIVDDVEGTEEVQSDEQRDKLRNWVEADLLKVIQRAKRLSAGEFPFRFLFIGTLLHQDSLLANYAESSKWHTITAPLCEVKESSVISLWSDFVTDGGAKDLYDEHFADDKMDIFNREFLCNPVPVGGGDFKRDYFRYFKEEDLRGVRLESIVLVDPARLTEARHNDTAIIGWSFCEAQSLLYMRDLIVGKLHPDDMYRQAAEMATRIKANAIGIESTGLGEFLTQPFKNFLTKWNYNFEFIDLKNRGVKNEKDDRILSLLPYYRQGRVLHNKACSLILEQQLMAGKFSKRKDAADIASRVIQALDLGNKLFSPDPLEPNVDGTTPSQFEGLKEDYAPTFRVTENPILNPFGIPESYARPLRTRLHDYTLPIFGDQDASHTHH